MNLKQRTIHDNFILLLLILYISIFKQVAIGQETIKKEKCEIDSAPDVKKKETGLTEDSIFEEIAVLLENAKGDMITLSLELGLKLALKNNLNIQIERIGIPLNQNILIEKEAHFDPVFFGEVYGRRYEQQTGSALSGTPISKENELTGVLGIRKLFKTGLQAETSFESIRFRSNSSFEGLDPQYKNLLLFNLRQPLLQDFGTRINLTDVKLAENRLEISRYRFASQVINVLDRAEQVYYDLARAIQALRLRKESQKYAEEILAGNRSRFQAGTTHIGEVQEAETAVASRREQVIFAQQKLKNVTSLFKNILQIRPPSPLYPLIIRAESLPAPGYRLPSHHEAFQLAFTNRPDLQRKKIEIENSNIRLQFDKNQLLPRLDLVGTFGLNGLSGRAETISFAGEASESPFDGDYLDSLDHLSEGDGYQWEVGIIAEIPLGNRAELSRFDQSRLGKERAILNLKNLEDEIDLEIKVALENIESSLNRFKVAETFEELAAKTLRQEEERMKRGLSTTFRILNFQEDLIDAKIRRINALADYHKSAAGLYKAIGTNYKRHRMHLNFE